jgi:hypothetical protein
MQVTASFGSTISALGASQGPDGRRWPRRTAEPLRLLVLEMAQSRHEILVCSLGFSCAATLPSLMLSTLVWSKKRQFCS